MKRLTYMTAVAALALAPAAFAKTSKQEASAGVAPGHSYTIVDRDMSGNTVRVKTTTYHEQIDAEGNIDYTGNYDLAASDNNLVIEGQTAYIVTPGGSKFYAPESSFETVKGQTFFIEDGKVLRMENPEIVYLDTDDLVN